MFELVTVNSVVVNGLVDRCEQIGRRRESSIQTPYSIDGLSTGIASIHGNMMSVKNNGY